MDHADLHRLVAQLRTLQRRQRAERRSVADLTRSATRVLGAVARADEAAQPSGLARELVMTSSNVAAGLRELTDRDLIARTPDALDSRRVNIALTAAGRRLVAEHRAVRDTWLAEAIEALLTDDEQATLLAAGELIERVAGYHGNSPSP